MAWTDITSLFRAHTACPNVLVPLISAQAAAASALRLRVTANFGSAQTVTSGFVYLGLADAALMACSVPAGDWEGASQPVTDGVAIGIQTQTTDPFTGFPHANDDTHFVCAAVNDVINCCGYNTYPIFKIEIDDTPAGQFWTDLVGCEEV